MSNLEIGLLPSSVENASYRGWTGETTMKNTSSFSSPSLLVSQVLLLFSAVCAGEIRHAYDLVVGRKTQDSQNPDLNNQLSFHGSLSEVFKRSRSLLDPKGKRYNSHILASVPPLLCLRREVVHKKGSVIDPSEVLIRLHKSEMSSNFPLIARMFGGPLPFPQYQSCMAILNPWVYLVYKKPMKIVSDG